MYVCFQMFIDVPNFHIHLHKVNFSAPSPYMKVIAICTQPSPATCLVDFAGSAPSFPALGERRDETKLQRPAERLNRRNEKKPWDFSDFLMFSQEKYGNMGFNVFEFQVTSCEVAGICQNFTCLRLGFPVNFPLPTCSARSGETWSVDMTLYDT